MVFQWNGSDSKSSQVSRTLLSILTDFNNAIVWMVSRPLISKSSSLWTNPLVTVPSAPVTICITVAFMFHSFFSTLARSRYLSLFFLLSILPCGQSTVRQVLFFCRPSQGLVIWPRLGNPLVSQNPKECCLSHFPGRILGCGYAICSYGQI